MKKLAIAMASLPGAALAHGGHAPVAEGLHGLTHMAIGAGAAICAGVVLVILVQRWRS